MQPLPRAVQIAQHGKRRSLYPREQQGRRARAKSPPLNGCQLQMRVNLRVYPPQHAVTLKVFHALTQRRIAHSIPVCRFRFLAIKPYGLSFREKTRFSAHFGPDGTVPPRVPPFSKLKRSKCHAQTAFLFI